jgi:hypothetical protein
MDKKMRIWAAAGIVVVVAAAAVGVGVYMFGDERQAAAPEADAAARRLAAEAEAGREAAGDEESDAEYDAFMAWLEEEAAKPDEAEATAGAEPEAAAAPVEEAPAAMPEMPGLFAGAGATGAGAPRWRAIWADLNLTAEEQGRLREGFGLLMARWATMPPEQQAAERARMQGMRMRWEGMNDDERAAASQRMRDRFEDWRASGRVELPELTLG